MKHNYFRVQIATFAKSIKSLKVNLTNFNFIFRFNHLYTTDTEFIQIYFHEFILVFSAIIHVFGVMHMIIAKLKKTI